MKGIITFIFLCAPLYLLAMNPQADYLSSTYSPTEWLHIGCSEPASEQIISSPSAMGLLEHRHCLDHQNVEKFTQSLYDELYILLRFQIATMIHEGAQWQELSSLIKQPCIKTDTLLLDARGKANQPLYKALLANQPAIDIFLWAIEQYDFDALKVALTRNVSVDSPINTLRETALIYWSKKKTHDSITRLLQFNANPNIQDGQGKTALIHAVICHHPDNIRTLFAYGANPFIKDKLGMCALLYAKSSLSMLKEIMQGTELYKCLTCKQHENKTLKLLSCVNNHLGEFICPDCLARIKANTNACPLCSNSLS